MDFKTIAYLLLGIFALIAAGSVLFTIKEKGRGTFIAFVYAFFFVYTIAQSVYYAQVLPGVSPDESAHISYIVYLRDTNAIIPKYEEMGLMSSELDWSQEETWYKYIDFLPNYVCHPPLYYQVMRLAGGIGDTANYHLYTLDKMRMRYFSCGIFAIGLALLLYIGYSRLDKNKPWLHVFYASAATCIPMFAFEGCAVTNDTMAVVTACITIIGLIRFSEKKRGYLTYILIATGISSSLLTKLTTALMCIIMALLVLFICMIKEKSVKDSINKYFFASIPIYCIALAYYGIIYKNYGTIQPSLEMICSKEYFESTVYYVDPAQRVQYTFNGYFDFYFDQFFLSWSGIVGTVNFLKATTTTKIALAMELLWAFPIFVLIPPIYRKSRQLALPIITGWVACFITMIIQFRSGWHVYLTRGYLGGNQARYYLPFIFAFALAFSFILSAMEFDTEQIGDSKAKKYWNYLLILGALGYAFVLFYGNFPFFLVHFAKIVANAGL